MRPSCLAVSLLVFLLFLSSVEGIRLEESFKSTVHPRLHGSAYGVKGDFIICKQGHCTGKSRKLFTATTASTPTSTISTSKMEDNEENKVNPTSKVKSLVEENGGKLVELLEMDYWPARKKPQKREVKSSPGL